MSHGSLQDIPDFPDFDDSDDLPLLESRIVNGDNATEGQFCYFVGVTSYGGPQNSVALELCGGSIIDSCWVLTAGHCCLPTINASEPITYHIEAGSIIAGEPQQLQVIMGSHAFVHPGFNSSTLENDVCLIKTDPFTFNHDVCYIDLVPNYWKPEVHVGESITAMGFGLTSFNGSLPGNLLWIDNLRLITRTECKVSYPIYPPTIFCAEDEGEPPISAVCQGDSGGPVAMTMEGKTVQVGLVSFGSTECNNAPQGFTNLAMFHDWIKWIMTKGHSNASDQKKEEKKEKPSLLGVLLGILG
ncbi:chymotrypsin-like protease CTRL-1 [Phlebotomus argentipes]|uniref:chymotrypsin-like protease CTRL-1 n=1 Tax=Phlebotomus argentipes TaxID=94469 RepID=UPI0028937448|nr:chymotrypsin-like protease CTRL-1 [Phlebotomus argentipes]